ncbi:MAG: hypothetical protein IJS45_07480 [Clostridia bacterium]|nr:hypothetical protein [Clostridia bacterium]
MKAFGIDVSLYQKGFDFARAKKEGVEFVIIKCSENNFTDPQFESHYAAAKKEGLHIGAYHYLRATTKAGAITEAKYAANGPLKGKQFDYPIFVDVEEPSIRIGKAGLTEIVKAFCDTLEAAGYWAGIYTNWDWYNHYLDGPGLAKRYSLWLAFWGAAMPNCEAQVWQFGGNQNFIRQNTVAGVVCDQNYCFVDFPTKIKAKGLNGYKATAKTTTTTAAKTSSTTAAKPKTTSNTTAAKTTAKKTVEQFADDVWAGKYGNDPERSAKIKAEGGDPEAVQRRVEEKYYGIKSAPKQTATPAKATFEKGDRVRIQSGAPVYGSNEKFAPFVYVTNLYITEEVVGDRAVVSTMPDAGCTGAVSTKYLTKV